MADTNKRLLSGDSQGNPRRYSKRKKTSCRSAQLFSAGTTVGSNAANKSARIIDNSRRNSDSRGTNEKELVRRAMQMVRKISFMYSNGRPEKTLPEGLMIPLKVKVDKRALQIVLHTLFRAPRYAFFVIMGICRGNPGFQIH